MCCFRVRVCVSRHVSLSLRRRGRSRRRRHTHFCRARYSEDQKSVASARDRRTGLCQGWRLAHGPERRHSTLGAHRLFSDVVATSKATSCCACELGIGTDTPISNSASFLFSKARHPYHSNTALTRCPHAHSADDARVHQGTRQDVRYIPLPRRRRTPTRKRGAPTRKRGATSWDPEINLQHHRAHSPRPPAPSSHTSYLKPTQWHAIRSPPTSVSSYATTWHLRIHKSQRSMGSTARRRTTSLQRSTLSTMTCGT